MWTHDGVNELGLNGIRMLLNINPEFVLKRLIGKVFSMTTSRSTFQCIIDRKDFQKNTPGPVLFVYDF